MIILQDIGAYFIMISKVFRRFTRWSVMKELIIKEIDSLIVGSMGIVIFISLILFLPKGSNKNSNKALKTLFIPDNYQTSGHWPKVNHRVLAWCIDFNTENRKC